MWNTCRYLRLHLHDSEHSTRLVNLQHWQWNNTITRPFWRQPCFTLPRITHTPGVLLAAVYEMAQLGLNGWLHTWTGSICININKSDHLEISSKNTDSEERVRAINHFVEAAPHGTTTATAVLGVRAIYIFRSCGGALAILFRNNSA